MSLNDQGALLACQSRRTADLIPFYERRIVVDEGEVSNFVVR